MLKVLVGIGLFSEGIKFSKFDAIKLFKIVIVMKYTNGLPTESSYSLILV